MPRETKSGAYAKLVANYARDDAVIEAGERAELLFVRALAFCADSDSDGFITDKQLERVVGVGLRGVRTRAETLVDVGLFVREDGGYLVRSWTKLHETAAQRGRRLKADRERKSRKSGETEPLSERNPDGFQPELVPESAAIPPDSLSMTVQNSAVQNSAEQGSSSLGEHRNETLPAPDATQPPPGEDPPPGQPPADARCTAHRGHTTPPPCAGCRAARERAERRADAAQERHQRAEAERIANCPDCHGTHWTETDDGTPARKCTHPNARRTA